MEMKGSDIVVECLLEQGVDTVFGYPGGTILEIYDSLYKYQDKINHILTSLGMKGINFYTEVAIWPALLLFLGIWKGFGYSSVMYYATIMGIDPTYYEAATVDGASKWQRIRNITIPQLSSLITVLTILAVGNIFRADFGLFYQIPHNAGALYSVTNVIDVYVYNGLTKSGDIGMTAAAGLYQSVVGLVLVLISNIIARRIDKNAALF